MMANAPLLALDGVACRRGARLLWRGVTLRLCAGGAAHVAGANGIGKSSLLRVAAGLLPAYAGRVDRPCPIALVDERLALDGDQTLAGALRFWARGDGACAADERAALHQVGIGHLADVPVAFLSTGQRKRAALARLLNARARLWLLDEPGNGLDQAGVALLESLMAAHRNGGGAVLLASHFALSLPGHHALDLGAYTPDDDGPGAWDGAP